MEGIYIMGGLIVAGVVALTVFKIRWRRAANKEARRRTERIDQLRVEDARRAEARGRAEKSEN